MNSNSEDILNVPMGRLPETSGRSFGPSSWRAVEQSDVTASADLSGDHNPIHIDDDFARSTPFGGTIAHGYLTLSLLPALVGRLYQVRGVRMGVNYGLNRVRFPAPVPVGARVRG